MNRTQGQELPSFIWWASEQPVKLHIVLVKHFSAWFPFLSFPGKILIHSCLTFRCMDAIHRSWGPMPKKRQLDCVRMEHCGGPPVCAARLQNCWSMRRTGVPSVKVGVLHTYVCTNFLLADLLASYLAICSNSNRAKLGKQSKSTKMNGSRDRKRKGVAKGRRQKS